MNVEEVLYLLKYNVDVLVTFRLCLWFIDFLFLISKSSRFIEKRKKQQQGMNISSRVSKRILYYMADILFSEFNFRFQ